MRFLDALQLPAVLTEGAVIERLRRDPSVTLDPNVLHAAFIYSDAEAAALNGIYREYLAIAAQAQLPILTFSPTWKANPDRLRAAGLTGKDVTGDGVRFLRALAAQSLNPPLVGGLMGCYGDAYKPREALAENDAAAFHREQARALAAADPDLLCAATLPAASEALGIARALSTCELPFVISFIVRAGGALLDGTPLREIIATIDRDVRPAPAAYFVNCVHPAVLADALSSQPIPGLIGLQANTSRKSPTELEGSPALDVAETPDVFAEEMLVLHRRHGIRVLGGCCGTDGRHIRALAHRLKSRR